MEISEIKEKLYNEETVGFILMAAVKQYEAKALVKGIAIGAIGAVALGFGITKLISKINRNNQQSTESKEEA